LTHIHFGGAQGWIAGYGGVILHSSNGGQTWAPQLTFTSVPLESVYFVDENHGWAAGWFGRILRTNDGGRTWQRVTVPGVWQTLSSVYFRDARNGWIVGMFGVILRTRDAGASWEQQPAPVRGWLTSITFSPSGTGWIAAGHQLLRSGDGGESWQPVDIGEMFAVSRIIAQQNMVYAIGPNFLVTRAADGGSETAWRKLEVEHLLKDRRPVETTAGSRRALWPSSGIAEDPAVVPTRTGRLDSGLGLAPELQQVLLGRGQPTGPGRNCARAGDNRAHSRTSSRSKGACAQVSATILVQPDARYARGPTLFRRRLDFRAQTGWRERLGFS
jgi:hypothetical protein